MTYIRLTGAPGELAARVEAAWELLHEPIPSHDPVSFWTETAERAEAVAAAYQELLDLGTSGLLTKLVIDARKAARSEAREAQRELANLVIRAAPAVSP